MNDDLIIVLVSDKENKFSFYTEGKNITKILDSAIKINREENFTSGNVESF